MVSISGGLFSLRFISFDPAYIANGIRACILCLLVLLLLFPFLCCSRRIVSPQRVKCYSSIALVAFIALVAYVSFLLKTNSVVPHGQDTNDMVVLIRRFELQVYIHSCCQ